MIFYKGECTEHGKLYSCVIILETNPTDIGVQTGYFFWPTHGGTATRFSGSSEQSDNALRLTIVERQIVRGARNLFDMLFYSGVALDGLYKLEVQSDRIVGTWNHPNGDHAGVLNLRLCTREDSGAPIPIEGPPKNIPSRILIFVIALLAIYFLYTKYFANHSLRNAAPQAVDATTPPSNIHANTSLEVYNKIEASFCAIDKDPDWSFTTTDNYQSYIAVCNVRSSQLRTIKGRLLAFDSSGSNNLVVNFHNVAKEWADIVIQYNDSSIQCAVLTQEYAANYKSTDADIQSFVRGLTLDIGGIFGDMKERDAAGRRLQQAFSNNLALQKYANQKHDELVQAETAAKRSL